MAGKITVIGSSNVDMIMQVEKLPAVGETVTDGLFLQTYGGKGANQAVAVARAGGDTTFVTCLGTDAYGDAMLANFAADGMNTEYIVRTADAPSGSALVMFDRQGDNYLTVGPGANYKLLPEHIDAIDTLIADSAMVVLQMEIPILTLERILAIAYETDTPVLFNYAPVRNAEIAVSSLRYGLIVNEIEAEALTGKMVGNVTEARAAGTLLREQGAGFVVLTLGAGGAFIVSDTLHEYVPAFRVSPVDTTAAGDVFCGALAVSLVEGQALPDAVRFASAAAALSVTRMGAQPSVPYRHEIDAFLAAN